MSALQQRRALGEPVTRNRNELGVDPSELDAHRPLGVVLLDIVRLAHFASLSSCPNDDERGTVRPDRPGRRRDRRVARARREMVLAFAEQGADVVIASRKLENCEQVRRRGRRRSGGERCRSPTTPASGTTATGSTRRSTTSSAGATCWSTTPGCRRSTSVDAITEALYDKVMDVNLKGPFRLSALVGTRMAATHGERAARSSSCRRSPRAARAPSELVYGAAKAGLNNLTYGLARTLGPTVRVNCIVPGPFLTDISKAWDLDDFERGRRPGSRWVVAASRARSSAPRCTSPATRRRTRPAR